MAPRIQQNRAPYLQIYDHYKRLIISGDLQPGDRLPTYASICDEFGVSQNTATKAVKFLEAEGLIVTKIGSRAEVSHAIHPTGQDRALAVRNTGKIYGKTGQTAEILSAETVPAPEDVARVLGCEPGDEVIKRVRITRDQSGKVVSYSTSWLPADRVEEEAPLLLSAERIPEGSWRYLARMLDLTVTKGVDQSWADLATDDQAETLGIQQPAAVRVSTQTITTDTGAVVEYGMSVSASLRRATYEYDIDDQARE